MVSYLIGMDELNTEDDHIHTSGRAVVLVFGQLSFLGGLGLAWHGLL